MLVDQAVFFFKRRIHANRSPGAGEWFLNLKHKLGGERL